MPEAFSLERKSAAQRRDIFVSGKYDRFPCESARGLRTCASVPQADTQPKGVGHGQGKQGSQEGSQEAEAGQEEDQEVVGTPTCPGILRRSRDGCGFSVSWTRHIAAAAIRRRGDNDFPAGPAAAPRKRPLAVGHSLFVRCVEMTRNGTEYAELGGTYFDERKKQAVTSRLVRRLQALGYAVDLRPSEQAA